MNNSENLTGALTRAFLYSLLIIVGSVLLYFIRDIILVFFVAIILSLAFDAPIDWLQKKGVHRLLGTFFFYLIIFSIFGGIFYLISAPLGEQLKNFNLNFPFIIQKLETYIGVLGQWGQGVDVPTIQDLAIRLSEGLTSNASRFFGSVVRILDGFASFLFILIISIYLNAREKGVKKFLLSLVPIEHHIYALNLIEQIQKKMGSWVWGTIIACFTVGLFIYLGLVILGINYALALAVLAAVLNLVPYIGPIISILPPLVLALIQSPFLAIWVIVLYLVVNLILEDSLIRPLIMKKAVGIDPLLIIFAVLVGGKLAGIIGIILAIPTAAIIGILFQEYSRFRMKEIGAEIVE